MSKRRKRPAGSKRRGPSVRREPSSTAEAAFARLTDAIPLVTCREGSEFDVMREVRSFLSEGEWYPPLPEDWSVMVGGHMDDALLGPGSLVLVYGVDIGVAGMIQSHLDSHPRAPEWDICELELDVGPYED